MEENKLNIKLLIGERSFPMLIEQKDEENFRLAASLAQQKYNKYKQLYKTKSAEDLLAMTIIDLAKNYVDLKAKKDTSLFFTELSDIAETLEDYLKSQ